MGIPVSHCFYYQSWTYTHWNEDFSCRYYQRRFWREDSHRLVLNRPYFGRFATVSRVHHHFFGTGRTTEPFAVAGIERFSVKH
jgi:hypothetical protein